MTMVMIIIGMASRTPVILWAMAMVCDTMLIMTFMLLRAMGKL